MELALDIMGERFTTLYQMSKPTYLSRGVFASLEIGILTYINHGGHVARLPVSYTSSLSFCHSSHVVVYFILLSVVSKFCSGLRGIFSSHTGQHEKLVPVSPVQSILCTYSRTPLIRPPSESHWCGRIRGMVAREGFVYEQKPLSVTRNVVV